MSRSRIGSIAVGLSMIATGSVAAQSTVNLTAPNAPGGGAVTAFGYYMSPYTGTVDGTTEQLNCVDFFHDVVVGQTWSAIQTNLGVAIGTPGGFGSTRDGVLGNPATIYEEVAWLTAQYPTDPASDPARSIAIQTAIWAIASNSPTQTYIAAEPNDVAGSFGYDQFSNPTTTGYWIYQAGQQYSQQSADYYNSFYILTDVNKNQDGSAQEFIYRSATPEPGTLVLLGTGLLLIVGFVAKSRRGRGFVGDALPVGALS